MPAFYAPRIYTQATALTATALSDNAEWTTAWGTWQEETSTATIHLVWSSWTETANTAATTLTNLKLWPTWVAAWKDAVAPAIITNRAQAVTARVDTRTLEQVAADEARHAARLEAELAARARRHVEQEAASERARALLLTMLDAHQREQLQRDRFFEVVSLHSRRRYRIREGTHGNVRLLDAQGREVTRYCGQPTNVPTEDAMLAQKLQIEHDEAGFLAVANASRIA